MLWNTHFNIEGKHSILSPSKYHWIRYKEEEQLERLYSSYRAALKGTELHEFASKAIQLGIKLPRTQQTLNMFVNDAIGFKMQTEQPLYFSENCFGHADAIVFRKNLLRIHDYKSGTSPCSTDQLDVYAAIFCLEYMTTPNDIQMELRIYQNNEVIQRVPPPEDILYIMQKIKDFDEWIRNRNILQGG